ncbi:concanavalin A-like lectin family protein [Striga asiatica]|uniref:Concanavalin A-like lectin family protein n=1 Tax=Striga asiatica TaxID=4170 RepID=A0A5A7RF85_STRAF|nr:concanavalin A-like lectin family protein [Striga asiatica]
MGAFLSLRYLLASLLLNVCLKAVNADPNLAFSFEGFGKDSNFGSQIALFGDAKVVLGNMSVEIAGSRSFSGGGLICKKPINLLSSRDMVSFSNYFVFSMSGKNGDGLAFFMLPSDFPHNSSDLGSMGILGEKKSKFLAVEFDTFMDEKYGDVNGNHVGLDIGSPVSVKVSNVSSVNLVLNSGEKLQSWIDYEASGKRIEVRLSRLGQIKPIAPLLTYPIDLSKMWRGKNVTVGLSSSSGNSSQYSIIYSWSFNSRIMPHWMHSEPLDPEGSSKKGESLKISKRSDKCALKILAALFFGSGCGAIGAFLVLYLWAVFGNRRPVVPEEFAVQTKESGYDKIDVLSSDKTIEDVKK